MTILAESPAPPTVKLTIEQTSEAMIDGNEAAARVAYALNEVIAIYPITPASNMGEWADDWAAQKRPNLWGTVPSVVEMESEAGAAGAVHGALQTGALATTFTASQGLLLMIPNMYKIAGELTPAVFHVAARSLATHALSIFGDHSDVMAARGTGWAMLCSSSVQEAHDFALIAQAASLESRIPFLHFFDGFRTSHEIAKVTLLSHDQLRSMIDLELVFDHRSRALTPDHPVMRGTAQNPDVFFQSRERANSFYRDCPGIVVETMERFAKRVGRTYAPYEYRGAPDADRVIVAMGSACETIGETVDALNARGENVGVVNVRLFRPFDVEGFANALPASVTAIAVLDRSKESGSAGEPLYLDVVTALRETDRDVPIVTGGRFGLSSKEFTPAMAKGVFDSLKDSKPRRHFTVGIVDDVTNLSIDFDPSFTVETDDVVRAMFYGLGSDGTVGANKNSCKIIGDTGRYAQGYFVYDSKKAGAVTVSHLRFGPAPIRAPYLIEHAQFVACHQMSLVQHNDVLKNLAHGGTFLINAPIDSFDQLPAHIRSGLAAKNAKLFVIDASRVARETGMGNRLNTIMQVAFFACAKVMPFEEALDEICSAVRKTYAKKGEAVVQRNLHAIDATLANLHEIAVTQEPVIAEVHSKPDAPQFVRDILFEIIGGRGDALPVSAMPCDGTFPTATAQYEKRNLAQEIPAWETAACIQCGKCAMVCPHAAIRIKVYDPALLADAPATFKSLKPMHKDWAGLVYTIQVAPEDCTGCKICVDVCPARSKVNPELQALDMQPQQPLLEAERANWDYFLKLPQRDRREINAGSIRQQQLQEPLFEFSGACSGCGETPYLKLMSQLFGDRAVIANATGCSSIFGGNLPTTPWSKNAEGRGPAWANSLFEDNAEFGLGFRLSIDKQRQFAIELLERLAVAIGENLCRAIIDCAQVTEAEIFEQRERVELLKVRLRRVELSTRMHKLDPTDEQQLLAVADTLVKKSVWIVGGDGWAYDIGFGGLDHVLASGRNVNILVLDTEVYSNTGGQMSKATPRSATARFAAAGKPSAKKDLGLMAMTYGNAYVASVAMGARDEHTLRTFIEAEAYDGPSLIIAYSHCIAHGIDMGTALQHQKAIVEAGQWLLYRFNPDRAARGENPLQLDSRTLKRPVGEFLKTENRFHDLSAEDIALAQHDVDARWRMYSYLSSMT
ncbi:MAG TPA: pyruvate:ferredoxin (flavodoxin) oxidoreductase [Thermoanaerobaculia bacterium]|jgi:pyruvate-ferredoxin/flavodoxin oxidoreductase|nr:pyruvate:ferredoxin (flavodoxin) oxidoreductase [Thermoanaerobaculia bacterium]